MSTPRRPKARKPRAQSPAAFMATLIKAWSEMEDTRGLTCHSLVYQAFQRWLERNPPKRGVKLVDVIRGAFYAGYAEGEAQAELVASSRDGLSRDLIASLTDKGTRTTLDKVWEAASAATPVHKGRSSHEPSPLITHMKAMAESATRSRRGTGPFEPALKNRYTP